MRPGMVVRGKGRAWHDLDLCNTHGFGVVNCVSHISVAYLDSAFVRFTGLGRARLEYLNRNVAEGCISEILDLVRETALEQARLPIFKFDLRQLLARNLVFKLCWPNRDIQVILYMAMHQRGLVG